MQVLVDFASLAVVVLSIVAAYLAKNTGDGRSNNVRSIVLKAGVFWTIVGFVFILARMDDPSAFLPAYTVALLTTFYAVVFAFFYGLSIPQLRRPRPMSTTLYPTYSGSGLFVLTAFSVMAWRGQVNMFFSLEAFGLTLAGTLLVILSTRRVAGMNSLTALVRYLPVFGGLTALAAFIVIIPCTDPTMLGPIVAIGLLTLLYSLFVSMCIELTVPSQVDPGPASQQWSSFVVSALTTNALFIYCIKLAFPA